MVRKQEKSVFVSKQVGETPLEALERYRASRRELAGIPMTYAGRLDPMAEGTLLILIGDECKNKDKYIGLNKEYEVEIVFGISTDTYDALGMSYMNSSKKEENESNISSDISNIDLFKYVGKFTQEYPAYSSKTVDGVQLHELARADDLPEEMPTKEVEIFSIEKIGGRIIEAPKLLSEILRKISLVRGDFRQEEIVEKWNEVLGDNSIFFNAIKIKIKCSSGTYMRSLANRIGEDLGIGAFALSIKRTKFLL